MIERYYPTLPKIELIGAALRGQDGGRGAMKPRHHLPKGLSQSAPVTTGRHRAIPV